jgi:hypothetical protein
MSGASWVATVLIFLGLVIAIIVLALAWPE